MVTRKDLQRKDSLYNKWLRENTCANRQHLGLGIENSDLLALTGSHKSLLLTPGSSNRSVRTAKKKTKMAPPKNKSKMA